MGFFKGFVDRYFENGNGIVKIIGYRKVGGFDKDMEGILEDKPELGPQRTFELAGEMYIKFGPNFYKIGAQGHLLTDNPFAIGIKVNRNYIEGLKEKD